ncbi:MAG: acyl-CoA dehydrogenase family protein [Microthrixaceae bacterium]
MTTIEAARELFDELDAAGAAPGGNGSFERSALEAIEAAGLYGLTVPEEVGGHDLPLVEVVRIWAELARADGSVGWCAFASDTALAYFGAYLPDDGIARVMDAAPAGHLPLVAGQFAPNGTAVAEGTDWVVDGEYRFGSGLLLADLAGAGFFATPADGGDAAYLMGCFPAKEIEAHGGWDVLGLRATQSIDYGVHDVRVPADQAFDFFAPTVHRGSAKHLLGVIPLTAAGHAAWALGVCRRMLDEFIAVAAGTTRMGAASSLAESDHVLISLARLESRHRAGWAWTLDACARAEAECAASGEFITPATANLLRQACVHVNRESVEIARELYSLAGTQALRDGPMQRCFRDLHAGTQHYFASDAASVDFARTLLGIG